MSGRGRVDAVPEQIGRRIARRQGGAGIAGVRQAERRRIAREVLEQAGQIEQAHVDVGRERHRQRLVHARGERGGEDAGGGAAERLHRGRECDVRRRPHDDVVGAGGRELRHHGQRVGDETGDGGQQRGSRIGTRPDGGQRVARIVAAAGNHEQGVAGHRAAGPQRGEELGHLVDQVGREHGAGRPGARTAVGVVGTAGQRRCGGGAEVGRERLGPDGAIGVAPRGVGKRRHEGIARDRHRRREATEDQCVVARIAQAVPEHVHARKRRGLGEAGGAGQQHRGQAGAQRSATAQHFEDGASHRNLQGVHSHDDASAQARGVPASARDCFREHSIRFPDPAGHKCKARRQLHALRQPAPGRTPRTSRSRPGWPWSRDSPPWPRPARAGSS